jgi:ethanolamine utilization cobalamin adenosyltransferase
MSVITEAVLRSRYKNGERTVKTGPGDFLTPSARDFIREKRMRVTSETDPPKAEPSRTAPAQAHGAPPVPAEPQAPAQTPQPSPEAAWKPPDAQVPGFVDIDGRQYDKKPEHMTHLRGRLLIPKAHPRIAFRGKMDSLQAVIINTQVAANREGRPALVNNLEEVLAFARAILSAEVKDAPLEEGQLFGYTWEQLRELSHNNSKDSGAPHFLVSWDMGESMASLNALRTYAREAELAAVRAFPAETPAARPDIVCALNRMSSAVYILMRRLRAELIAADQRGGNK